MLKSRELGFEFSERESASLRFLEYFPIYCPFSKQVGFGIQLDWVIPKEPICDVDDSGFRQACKDHFAYHY